MSESCWPECAGQKIVRTTHVAGDEIPRSGTARLIDRPFPGCDVLIGGASPPLQKSLVVVAIPEQTLSAVYLTCYNGTGQGIQSAGMLPGRFMNPSLAGSPVSAVVRTAKERVFRQGGTIPHAAKSVQTPARSFRETLRIMTDDLRKNPV